MKNINWNDKDEVLKLVQQDGTALKYASKELRNDRNIVTAAVREDGLALIYASKELQDSKDVALTALQKNPDAFTYVSPRLKQDQDIQEAAGLEPDIKQKSEKPDIDTVLGDARKWCQEHNDTPAVQPQHNIER